ncbi:MAG TPA: nuclear transport factor 2 family protein [Nitrospiria bacterium]
MDKNSFQRAVEAKQLDQIVGTFAENAVLNSPVSFKPIKGRPAIRQLLTILLKVFQEFRYTDQLKSNDGTLGLVFHAKIGNRQIEGLDLLRFDEKGFIRELTVMVRPRSAIEALQKEVGSLLAP